MTQDKLDPPLMCIECNNLLYDVKYRQPEHCCPVCGSCSIRLPPPGMSHCSDAWFERNKTNLLEALPETWTHFSNINVVALIYRLKLLGLTIRSDLDLAACLANLETRKFLLRDGLLLRRANI